jgi:hypothetical protein
MRVRSAKVKDLAGPWTTGNLEPQALIHLSISWMTEADFK